MSRDLFERRSWREAPSRSGCAVLKIRCRQMHKVADSYSCRYVIYSCIQIRTDAHAYRCIIYRCTRIQMHNLQMQMQVYTDAYYIQIQVFTDRNILMLNLILIQIQIQIQSCFQTYFFFITCCAMMCCDVPLS